MQSVGCGWRDGFIGSSFGSHTIEVGGAAVVVGISVIGVSEVVIVGGPGGNSVVSVVSSGVVVVVCPIWQNPFGKSHFWR